MSEDAELSESILRPLLNSFWNDALEIETTHRGLVFTMPVSYPHGWQVVLELGQKTPRSFLLSDRGKTLSWLAGQGLNIHTEAIQGHLKRLCEEHFMREENGVLQRWLDVPLDATDIHVFAEGLAAIARLDFFNEHRVAEENVADTIVQRVFHDADLEPLRHHKLNITKDRKVTVDYFIELARPLAVQLIKSKSDVSGTMEKWGFRWHELKKHHARLAPVMLYDRSVQIIDSYSHHIGETECELFCGYDETDRIHETLATLR